MSDSHLERKIDFKRIYSCYILISSVFSCLPASLHNMNCSRKTETNDPFKAVTQAPQCSPSCAFRLTGPCRSLSLSCHHHTLYSEAQATASKSLPTCPHDVFSQLLTSSIIRKIRVRGRDRTDYQMADRSKIFGLSLDNSLEFSCKSQPQC